MTIVTVGIDLAKNVFAVHGGDETGKAVGCGGYMRRTAHGRKADVRYDAKIVLKLGEVVRVSHTLHREMIAKVMTPPQAIWSPVDFSEVATPNYLR